MAIVAIREAKQKEQECADCKKKIKIGEKYYDSDEKLEPPKPFPSKKYCPTCGEKQPKKLKAKKPVKK